MKIFKSILLLIENEIIKNKIKHVGKNVFFSRNALILGGKYIEIGDGFSAFSNLRIEAIDQYINYCYRPFIKIGNYVSFGNDCHIGCINEVIISDGVLLGSHVLINDHSHGQTEFISNQRPADRELVSKGPIHIGKNVWICDGVCVMPGVTIGENSIIGANAVVTKDVPANCVAAGNPAKVIKYLKKCRSENIV